MFHAKLVDQKDLDPTAGLMVGPIAAGETPEQVVERMEGVFGHQGFEYAYVLHEKPIELGDQQFPSIIGSVWIAYKEVE